MEWLGQIGFALPLGLGAIGSALGIGAAGRGAAGAWAKEGREGKNLDFRYVILTAMPLSQTIYGLLVSLVILKPALVAGVGANGGWIFCVGLAAGLGELFSAWRSASS